jgi:hypothetical protein
MKKKLKVDDFDLVVLPGPLTLEEEKLISEFIRQDKEKRKKKHGRKRAAA